MQNWLLNASARVQKVIALSLLVVTGSLVVWTILNLVERLAEQKAMLIETRERAGRLQMLSEMDLSRTEATANTGNENASLFMNVPSVAIARANLQERLNLIARTSNTIVASAGNLPDLKEGNSTLIGLRVDFSGAYEDVSRMLLAIETGIPPLIVKELNVRSAGIDQPDQPPELSAQVRVYGAVRISTPEIGERHSQ